jgi:hypothetical protein
VATVSSDDRGLGREGEVAGFAGMGVVLGSGVGVGAAGDGVRLDTVGDVEKFDSEVDVLQPAKNSKKQAINITGIPSLFICKTILV